METSWFSFKNHGEEGFHRQSISQEILLDGPGIRDTKKPKDRQRQKSGIHDGKQRIGRSIHGSSHGGVPLDATMNSSDNSTAPPALEPFQENPTRTLPKIGPAPMARHPFPAMAMPSRIGLPWNSPAKFLRPTLGKLQSQRFSKISWVAAQISGVVHWKCIAFPAVIQTTMVVCHWRSSWAASLGSENGNLLPCNDG
jgi:hypothetical protein